MQAAIGYLRVSTREQGRSGLGLAAQRFEIEKQRTGGTRTLTYATGRCSFHYFDSEGAARLTSFFPQLWIPELRAFRQDPRFTAL
jgi:DNA invertase Pin-like site-specific DNA recombinase